MLRLTPNGRLPPLGWDGTETNGWRDALDETRNFIQFREGYAVAVASLNKYEATHYTLFKQKPRTLVYLISRVYICVSRQSCFVPTSLLLRFCFHSLLTSNRPFQRTKQTNPNSRNRYPFFSRFLEFRTSTEPRFNLL